MAKYYYDKYTVEQIWEPDPSKWNWKHYERDSNPVKVSTGISFNGSTFTLTGTTEEMNVNSPEGMVRYYGGYTTAFRARRVINGWIERDRAFAEDVTKKSVRGTVVQSNIQAENGTYPSNGIHTDGYWYVRGSAVPTNTAPSMPGAFTAPTGDLEIGDSKVISWGRSTDAENNISRYRLEVSINGGAFTLIANVTSPSYTYTIPTAANIKFRVRAEDSGGLTSSYRESAVFTVTKPKYYWSKYNEKSVPEEPEKWNWKSEGDSLPVDRTGGTSITLSGDPVSPFRLIGPQVNLYNLPVGSSVYDEKGRIAYRYLKIEGHGYKAAIRHSAYLSDVTYESVRGDLVQSGIIAAEGSYPIDGKYTDGFWYVRGSKVNMSIAPPSPFSTPATGAILEPKQALTLTFGASTAPSISAYEVQYRYNENPWANVGTHTNTLTRAFTVTEDKTLKTVEFRVRAKNTSNVYSDYIYSEVFTVQHNKIPSITLNTDNNKTLYENDSFVIEGTALEPDVGDVLIVYYKINGGLARGFATKVSDGTAMSYKETLTFKSGKLHRGETAITDTLKEGTPYTLDVWAEDNQGGKSEIETRTFYVVPNRPPTLSIDAIEEASGLIDSDKVTINGMSADPDGNNVTVRYRINEETAVQIHNGPAGPFTFDVQLSKLKDGENTIVVEAIDTHDFKVSKTITLNKSPNQTPLAKSVQRYTIVPPAGNAKVVYLWLERDASERVQVDISMTNGTEPESFVPMIWNDEDSKEDPQPVTIAPGIVEDFFKFQSEVPAEKIAIQLSWTGDKPLFKVTGALLK
ncbi:hypothetical protein [Sporosarcina sp. Te-1]|uniref:hypothetical protein n=1 Tax=Sporosarcina sp. Te-1 TaxID=2818390 RepID=UPI001A9DA20F|nr:hypothetical protein [Sporosarcina sp. Te-1]QTD40656.1 hypothetical protein J3U78_18130 [Sporosarcina sp. Te-1]